MLGYGGQKGCREHQWCRSSVPSQGYHGSSKIRQNDMLSIRDQLQEKILERVREELGDFCRKESWEISAGGAPCVEMRGSQPTSLVTLNQVSNLFTSEGDVASVLVYILCLPSLVQT